MRVLLDTHVLIWLVEGDKNLTTVAIILDRPNISIGSRTLDNRMIGADASALCKQASINYSNLRSANDSASGRWANECHNRDRMYKI
jgi:hypothetical protein